MGSSLTAGASLTTGAGLAAPPAAADGDGLLLAASVRDFERTGSGSGV
jgi:hypothetical protein